MLVETHDLTFAYQGSMLARKINASLRINAISDLSLRIQSGARLALLGANGAGKSTLLLHLNGTLRPLRGHVSLHGKSVGYDKKSLLKWRSQVALVFQDPDHQIFAGTVEQDVSFGPANLGLPLPEIQERVDFALRTLELTEFAALPPHMLSHGQRKRVALAGALAMKPNLLLLDEPTAGLDPHGTDRLLRALNELSSQGITQVLSTHDLDLALDWASEVAILHEGSVIAQGDPKILLSDNNLMTKARLRVPYALRRHS